MPSSGSACGPRRRPPAETWSGSPAAMSTRFAATDSSGPELSAANRDQEAAVAPACSSRPLEPGRFSMNNSARKPDDSTGS